MISRIIFFSTLSMVLIPVFSMAQTELFYDDFSQDSGQWETMGNTAVPTIADGKLYLEWGYAPHWFVTKDTFQFGSEPLQFDFTFVQGGFQATSNYKQNYVFPLLGATAQDRENGAVRASFSADYFDMERYSLNADEEATWEAIPLESEAAAPSLEPGMRVRIEIDRSAQNGELFLDGNSFLRFQTQPVMEGGVGFRVVTANRNVIVDDVYFSQIDQAGTETVILEDDFNRSELGEDWINETLADDTTPGPVDAFIQENELYLTNDGSGDGWLRTSAQTSFSGQITVFEYTFVDYIEGSNYRPSPVLGVKPFESGSTNGVILVDNGTGFNYGMVNGGWSGGQALQLGSNRPGMRFKIVVDAGGQSGTVYRDGVEGLRFFNLGPALTGAFAFRTIVDRDAMIDDIRIYTLEPDGSETTLFEDDFNRDQLGEDWVSESITPDVLPGAQFASVWDYDDDGDYELVLDHDETADDSWCRLKKELPFSSDKPVVIEGTYVDFVNFASVVIGSSEWVANQIAGPILLDNLQNPWIMDTREGNVWVRPGPIGGSEISLQVNADGMSGAFLVNGVVIREWEFAEGEDPILPGAVGFMDPFDSPQPNVSPPAVEGTFATAQYDDVRVLQLGDTAIQNWMVY